MTIPPAPPEHRSGYLKRCPLLCCYETCEGFELERGLSAEEKLPVEASCTQATAVRQSRTRSQAASMRRCRSNPTGSATRDP